MVGLALVAPPARADTRDQVNEPAWTGAAVNIAPENEVTQTIVPALPLLTRIEVALKTGNPGRGGDQITLTLTDADGMQRVTQTQLVKEGFDGFLQFLLPGGGESVTPGRPITIRLSDTGKVVFWWKYAGGDPYRAGKASFHGAAFKDNDFLFRTYGDAVAPGIAFTITPEAVTVTRGGIRNTTVGVTRTGGAGAATIAFRDLPQGVSVSPPTITTTGSSAGFTFSASPAAPPGQYTASIVGVAGPAHGRKSFRITVSSPGP